MTLHDHDTSFSSSCSSPSSSSASVVALISFWLSIFVSTDSSFNKRCSALCFKPPPARGGASTPCDYSRGEQVRFCFCVFSLVRCCMHPASFCSLHLGLKLCGSIQTHAGLYFCRMSDDWFLSGLSRREVVSSFQSALELSLYENQWNLSISFNIFQYLSISFNIFQYLSISFNIFQYLSISFNIFQNLQ